MKTSDRRATLQLFGLATLGAVLIIAGAVVNQLTDPGSALRVGLALLPVVPLGVLACAIFRAIRSMDEMQRRIHLEAMTGAFVGGAFLALVYGQLQHARLGLPDLNWAFLWPVEVVLWIIAYVIASRRYS